MSEVSNESLSIVCLRRGENNTVIILQFVLVIFILVFSQKSEANIVTKRELLATPEKITGLLENKKISPQEVPNPHWNARGCISCHTGKPSRKHLKLRTKNIATLCGNCHSKLSDKSYFHPTEIKPSKDKLRRMAKGFKKNLRKSFSKGIINCVTCHDVIKQCYTSNFQEKGDNHEFFRGGPYTTRTAICFNCHNKKKYNRFNPHKQIYKNGKVLKKSCLMCHKDSKYIFKRARLKKYEFNVGNDWKKMCTGCHPWKPHPGGELSFGKKVPNHLVKPGNSIIKTMNSMMKKNHIYLPLEPRTGKIYCGTCHDPHQAGVNKVYINKSEKSRKFRLRAKKLCSYCHDLY